MTHEQIITDIDARIEKPLISARFGDNWKEHQKRMIDEGQINVEMIIALAWKQGRRALLMEDAIKRLAAMLEISEISGKATKESSIDGERVEELTKVIKLIFHHFPKDIIEDQMGEDYHQIEETVNRITH